VLEYARVLALIEVMDKETPPWSAAWLLPTFVVVGLVCGLGSRRRLAYAASAVCIAVVWILIRAQDDVFDKFVGPAMRAELRPGVFVAYWIVVIAESLAPFTLSAVLLIRRLRQGKWIRAGAKI
jgi:hypothetical protein